MTGRARRSAVAIGAQAVSSFGNILLVISVARTASAEVFGVFALSYAIYLVANGLSRALASEPLVVKSGVGPLSPDLVAGSLATAITLGVTLTVPAVTAGVVTNSIMVLVFGAVLAPLLAHDAARMALLASGRPGAALAIDSVWTASQCVLFAVVALSGHGPAVYVAAWGLAGTLAAACGMLLIRLRPGAARLAVYWKDTAGLKWRYAVEFMAGAGALQAIHFTIAASLGLTAVGALRAAQSVLGPFNQVLTAISVGLMAEVVRLRREAPDRFVRALVGISAVGAVGVAGGTWALSAIPSSAGVFLLGATWQEASGVLVPAGITIAGNMAIVGPLLGLRALADARTSMRCRILTSATTVLCAGVALLLWHAIVPVAWGITLGVWLGAALWWISLRYALARQPAMSASRTGVFS